MALTAQLGYSISLKTYFAYMIDISEKGGIQKKKDELEKTFKGHRKNALLGQETRWA